MLIIRHFFLFLYPSLENSTTRIAIGGYHGGHYKKSYYKRNRYGRSVTDDPNADREFSDIQEGDLQVDQQNINRGVITKKK